jgi:hypothetical protein
VKKPVISYDEYIRHKKISEALVEEIKESSLNENFLTNILNFFKGLFDLFNNKELKKEAEETTAYIKRIENNDEIPDSEVPEELDGKKLKRSFTNSNKYISKQIEVDKEKGIRVSNELIKKLASWIGQLVTVQGMTKTDMLQKMLRNTETSKRFTWVPTEYRENPLKWYKDKDCKLEKSIREALLVVLEAEPQKQEKMILDFAKRYIEFVAKTRENGLKKLKENDPDFLDDIFLGFVQMTNSIVTSMSFMMKNTDDDKLVEIVADKIISNRARRADVNPNKKNKQELDQKQEKDETVTGIKKKVTSKKKTPEPTEDSTGDSRSRKSAPAAPVNAPKPVTAATRATSTPTAKAASKISTNT